MTCPCFGLDQTDGPVTCIGMGLRPQSLRLPPAFIPPLLPRRSFFTLTGILSGYQSKKKEEGRHPEPHQESQLSQGDRRVSICAWVAPMLPVHDGFNTLEIFMEFHYIIIHCRCGVPARWRMPFLIPHPGDFFPNSDTKTAQENFYGSDKTLEDSA